MPDLLGLSIVDIQFFILILVRVSTLFVVAPLYSSALIDRKLKVAISLLISLLLFNVVDKSVIIMPDTLMGMIPLITKEFMVGIIIGFAAGLIFQAIQLAGRLIGRQMGIAMANVLDPDSQQQVPVVGQYLTSFATILFLLIDGHHWLIKSFVGTYDVVPLSGFKMTPLFYEKIISMTGNVFVMGIKISAPIYVGMLLLTVILGVMARAVQSMNIFAVGFPIKLLSGMLLLLLFVEVYAAIFIRALTQFQMDVDTLIYMLA